ncbi:hypothetical protein NDU88_003457 [Pleurodeles waltl]|uniref:Uncharacterized protein n=1 Tax=Pleurodeles waltl TaxID=8319 RepID=A0AAV7LH48_PLEWA|nr:hypothetical protein NDU88_003457 [Pleurodeles waltl]
MRSRRQASPQLRARYARESPLERCASPPAPRPPVSRGAGRREAPPRRWCCYRAWGTRAPEPGPGNPRCTCGCPINGARLFRTAPPHGGLSPGPSAHLATHSGSALGDLAGTPVLPAGRPELTRHLGFHFASATPVAFSSRGSECFAAGPRGLLRVPEPVGAPRVIFSVLWQSLLGADDGGVQSTLRVRPPS